MVCIHCGANSKVTNSRPHRRNQLIWRRRQCLNCGRIWSSYETSDPSTLIVVKSKDDQLVPFDRDKLFVSIYNSCQHRVQPIKDTSALCATIMPAVYKAQVDGVIGHQQLIHIVAQTLSRFDQAATVHYQAFHQS